MLSTQTMEETSWRLEAKVNYSDSVTTETPPAFEVLRQDVGYATQFTARSVGMATQAWPNPTTPAGAKVVGVLPAYSER